jgi:hypothetical protein
MKRWLAVLLIPLAASTALAGKDLWLVLAESTTRTVAIRLTRDADYVVLPITLSSDQREPEIRFAEINDAITWLNGIVKDHPRISVHTGPATLSGKTSLKWLSYGDEGARVWILATFAKDDDNIFTCGTEISRFLKSLTFPGRVSFVAGPIQLAVRNPEEHRDRLLEMIHEEVTRTRSKLVTRGNVVVRGLESPVVVRQLDDRRVELYLNYEIAADVTE